jgi:DNA topoisomerase VI subunit B
VEVRKPPGLETEGRSYFAQSSFSDPDGNTWVLQEVTTGCRAGNGTTELPEGEPEVAPHPDGLELTEREEGIANGEILGDE